MLRTLTPNMMVEDVRETMEWYGAVLRFEVDTQVPGDGADVAFAILHRDDVRLMLQSRASLTADLPVLEGMPIGSSQTFYVEVDNVEELRAEVEGRAEIVKDLHDTFYGTREFYMRDLNGYILSFSQSL